MSHGDIHEFRERVKNIEEINHPVLTAKAEHLIGRLIEEWAHVEMENLIDRPSAERDPS